MIYASEYKLDFVPFENKFLKGYIDRIEQISDDDFFVYDYKTGSAKPKTQIADGKSYEGYLNQLRFYKYAFEIQNPGKTVLRAGLIFVEEPDKSFYTDLNCDDNEIIKEKMKYVFDNLEKLNFNLPMPDERNCEHCDYIHLCKLSDMKDVK